MLLYIHIPFCDSKCFYCAFNSYTTLFQLKDDYVEALIKQLQYDLKTYAKKSNIRTVFIGGGTPSCLKAQKYDAIFEIIQPYLTADCEITTEANPNSATFEWQAHMKSLGVNRISFGVQSFDNDKLKFLGRAHNAQSAIESVHNAKKVGFDSINCDIIYGVHNDTFESLQKDFLQVKALEIEHLSAYSLTIEEGTKFFNKSKVKIDDEELSIKIFDYLENMGFHQYEISNFAMNESSQSKHNYGYWQHEEYLGVGCGAVGFVKDFRYYPNKDLPTYINNPLNYEKEFLSQEDIKVEKVLLGFRCSNGVEKTLFSQEELERIDLLINEKKLKEINNRIYNQNFLLADELALFIMQ